MKPCDIDWKPSVLPAGFIKYTAYFIYENYVYTKVYMIIHGNDDSEIFVEQYPKPPEIIISTDFQELVENVKQITEAQYLAHYKDPWEI